MAPENVLARVQRNALVCCAAMTGIAAVGWGWRAAVAVLAGGLLAGASWWLVKSGVLDLTAFADAPPPRAAPPRLGFAILKLTGRYALLGFLAYVMIARLRLHPLGLIAGASSVVAGAAVEAGRLLRNNK